MIKPISEPTSRSAAPQAPAEVSSASAVQARRPVLPPYRTLAVAATIPNAVVIALALVTAHLMLAVSLVCGLAIALLLYAGIYSFVNGAAGMLVNTIGGRANVDAKGFMPQLALLTLGKFIGIGILLFVMFRFIHVSLPALLVGFLIAQFAITLACIRSLKSTPLLG